MELLLQKVFRSLNQRLQINSHRWKFLLRQYLQPLWHSLLRRRWVLKRRSNGVIVLTAT